MSPRLWSCLAVLLLSLAANAEEAKGKRFAVLVGVGAYKHDKLPDLRHTENDVEELAKVLAEKAVGFAEVVVLTSTRGKKSDDSQPTAANVRRKLKRIFAKVGKHDMVLIAFAGHGLQIRVIDPLQNKKERDESFFCPSDAKPRDTKDLDELKKTMIPLSEVFKELEESGAGIRLLLADCCRDEPKLGRNPDVDSLPRLAPGTAALFSCKGGERAFETDKLGKGTGVFFYHVIQAFKGTATNRRGDVTWPQLTEYVTDKVSEDVPALIGGGAKQTPQEIKNIVGRSPVLRFGRATDRRLDATELDAELDRLAGKIREFLEQQPSTELRFAAITSLERKDDPHAAGLQQAILVRLQEGKIAVKEKAAFELSVGYGFAYDDQAEREVFRLRALLRKSDSRDAKAALDVTVSTKDMRDLSRYGGVSLSLPLKGSAEERNEAFRDARRKPSVHVSGVGKTRVSSSTSSPHYVELVAGAKGGKGVLRERKVTVVNGMAFAAIELDEEYRIRVINKAPYEVACGIYVDGIDFFEFSDDRDPNGEPRFKHVLVAAESETVIRGWHETADPDRKDHFLAFLVTEYGKGGGFAAEGQGKVGTIQVSFAWSFNPDDKGIRARSKQMETGFGRPLEGKQVVVRRKIDPPHDVVTIRYSRGTESKN